MTNSNFKKQVAEALDCTKEGLNLILEISELQEAIKLLPLNETFEQMVKEVLEKEKYAVSLLQKSNLIQKSLISNQRLNIQKIIDRL